MNIIVNVEEIRKKQESERKRERLSEELEKLFWQKPKAYIDLCNFCEDRLKNKLDAETKKLLIGKGLIYENGNLPLITRELVYEVSTGQKPAWVV